jgi:monoamine oxidase
MIVVIGAGMTGLCAAMRLRKLGYSDVLVLEASSRVGGRVRTLRARGSDMFVEAGATWIMPTHEGVLDMMKKLSLEPVPREPEQSGEMYHVAGRRFRRPNAARVDWPMALRQDERAGGLRAMNRRHFLSHLNRLGDVRDPQWPPPDVATLDEMSLHEFFRQDGASEAAAELVSLGYFDCFGDGSDSVSALHVMRDVHAQVHGREPKATWESAGVPDGFDQLPQAMARSLGTCVHVDSPVMHIDQNTASNGLVCRTPHGDVVAEQVICTVPPGVLGQIRGLEAFAPEKLRALSKVRNTAVTRVYVEFTHPYWRDLGLPGTAYTDLGPALIFHQTATQPVPGAILDSYFVGGLAMTLAGMTDDARREFLLTMLEQVYPGARAHYVRDFAFDWMADEWSRGAYAWFAPRELTAFVKVARTSTAPLHFAGDYLSPLPGWMEGALEAGEAVANDVCGFER